MTRNLTSDEDLVIHDPFAVVERKGDPGIPQHMRDMGQRLMPIGAGPGFEKALSEAGKKLLLKQKKEKRRKDRLMLEQARAGTTLGSPTLTAALAAPPPSFYQEQEQAQEANKQEEDEEEEERELREAEALNIDISNIKGPDTGADADDVPPLPSGLSSEVSPASRGRVATRRLVTLRRRSLPTRPQSLRRPSRPPRPGHPRRPLPRHHPPRRHRSSTHWTMLTRTNHQGHSHASDAGKAELTSVRPFTKGLPCQEPALAPK